MSDLKATQISDHIWRLGIRVLLPIHVWIVCEQDGITLVDGGIGWMEKGIRRFIHDLGAGPLRRIVLTHGHYDHVGVIPALLREWDVPVYVHGSEIQFMEGRLPYPRRKKATPFLPPGIAEPLPSQTDGTLSPIQSLVPYAAPGHSPGHTVYYDVRDDVLIAGDLFTVRRGQLRRPIPMFTADLEEAIQSGSIVQTLKPKLMTVCHGTDVADPHLLYEGYARTYSDEGSACVNREQISK